MALSASATRDQRRFRGAQAVCAALVVLFAVFLTPIFPSAVREAVSALGLLVAGAAATGSGLRRALRTKGHDARPWWILFGTGTLLIIANAWVAVSGSDPIKDPSLFSIISIAVALVAATVGMLLFPGTQRRGPDVVVMFLDGLVAGGAFLLIASVLVYSELLNSGFDMGDPNEVFGLIFPVQDVVLATVAVLLVVRARRSDRVMLVLVAGAFITYAGADMAFAVRTTKDGFGFGTMWDLGWILGYLLLGLATWAPIRRELDEDGHLSSKVSDALGTSLVFSVFVLATVVQVVFGNTGRFEGLNSVLWVVIVVAAGVRQIVLTLDNATLRRDLEKQVAEQTADLRSLARENEVLITSVGDGVYGVDRDGRITFVNPSAVEALGWSAAELKGRLAHDMFHSLDQDGNPYPWAGCYIFEAIRHGQSVSSEDDEYIRADGSTFPVEITASPLVDDNEIRGAVVVFRDVTQRREVDRLKDEFLSVVSHELRTPLTSIRGSLGLLAGGRMGELPDRAASLVNVATQSTERLTRLINDLLDIERMQSGTRPMEVTTLAAHHVLESAARQIEGMASSAGVRIEVEATDGRVLADEDRVMQTLLNLVGNAIKFSEPGASVLLQAQESGDEVHFRVTDTGRGIPAEKLESIFERFEQVDSSDTRQKGGTGLGLAISKGIVERHGGRIWAESELGRGTTIHFTLPSAPRLSTATETGAGRPGAPTVLVCDDDAAVVEQFSALLRLHGYRPIGVTDGTSAVEIASLEHPQAVVLDLMMPGTTGAEVLTALRGAETTRDIPVVVISGLGPEADADVARESDDWLIKPVSEGRLVQAVSMAVSSHHTGGTILLIEDDAGLAEVITTMLAHEGLEVAHATSATEAIELGQELRPDVIVLDMRLPDGSGGDVVAAFSQRWSLAQTPLVVYSAADVDLGRREELQLGETVFLTKGRTSPEELRDSVLGLVRVVTSGSAARI